MKHLALFHSVLGLRPVELDVAARLEAAGCSVVAPDLFAGEVASTVDEGFALAERIGWKRIFERALEAVAPLPDDALLAGVSMGCGVVSGLLPARPLASGALLLHGLIDVESVRAGLPLQLHVGTGDALFPPKSVDRWKAAAKDAGARIEGWSYRGAAHFFLDPESPDHDPTAAALVWPRVAAFVRER